MVTPQQEKILWILDLRIDPQRRLKVGAILWITTSLRQFALMRICKQLFSQRFAQEECCHFRAGAELLAKGIPEDAPNPHTL